MRVLATGLQLHQIRVVISAASKAGTIPSLSVVQMLQSRRTNDAPALSSPPKPSKSIEQSLAGPRLAISGPLFERGINGLGKGTTPTGNAPNGFSTHY
jgi:hypothetical protein